MNVIEIKENSLDVQFLIRDNGVVELSRLLPLSKDGHYEPIIERKEQHPILELQVTGKTTRGIHANKHYLCSNSLELTYQSHSLLPTENGKELILFLADEAGLKANYHMRFFTNIPVVQVWTELSNEGSEALGLEYVSSFLYRELCGVRTLEEPVANAGEAVGADSSASYIGSPFPERTEIYVPQNAWFGEAQWKNYNAKELTLNGMTVDGFGAPRCGTNCFLYGNRSSWSSCEYLPMGYVRDTEKNQTFCFEIEHSGQWMAEYGGDVGGTLYLALSGATSASHGWWKELKHGMQFSTVPVAFGVTNGGIDEATAALTAYRRVIRRQNRDDEILNVVFNDYMNCLFGDPTEEKEHEIVDRAAALGCEYFCLDCGWYSDGFWWDSVGEWKESKERFPNGLKSLCDYVRGKGMKMGIWVEIEVMGIACRLADTLPDDWFVCRHGKRHVDNFRYLLDFRNPEVRRYCSEVMDRLIADYGVEYIKMDYNVTWGYGSDVNSDSCAEAMREHYLCLYQWYADLFAKYPSLIVENCGSGGMRMDYGMLKLLSLQSTSDQTDYLYNSRVAANVASAVTPEQAGMWVYPYEDEEEHVIYNMVGGLLLRPYISGRVWDMSQTSLDLMQEGVALK